MRLEWTAYALVYYAAYIHGLRVMITCPDWPTMASSESDSLCSYIRSSVARVTTKFTSHLVIRHSIPMSLQVQSFNLHEVAYFEDIVSVASPSFASVSFDNDKTFSMFPVALLRGRGHMKDMSGDYCAVIIRLGAFKSGLFWFRDSNQEIRPDQVDFDGLFASEVIRCLGFTSSFHPSLSFVNSPQGEPLNVLFWKQNRPDAIDPTIFDRHVYVDDQQVVDAYYDAAADLHMKHQPFSKLLQTSPASLPKITEFFIRCQRESSILQFQLSDSIATQLKLKHRVNLNHSYFGQRDMFGYLDGRDFNDSLDRVMIPWQYNLGIDIMKATHQALVGPYTLAILNTIGWDVQLTMDDQSVTMASPFNWTLAHAKSNIFHPLDGHLTQVSASPSSNASSNTNAEVSNTSTQATTIRLTNYSSLLMMVVYFFIL